MRGTWSACVVVMLLIGAGFALAAEPAKPPESAKSPERRRLANVVEFTPPEGWEEAKKVATESRAAFISSDHRSMLAVEVLPPDAELNDTFTKGVIKKLREMRALGKETFVTPPEVISDARFGLRIRERYKTADNKIGDSVHLYRYLGPRVLMVTAKQFTDDVQDKPAAHGTAEQTSLNAAFLKPATPPKRK